jgi:hypothetical protein
MPRPLRHRFVPELAAACVGGALLAPGTALAAGSTVTFEGGCGLLGVGASARPDTGALTVRSGSTVTFVNHLGQSAKLTINGADRATVPANSQVGVVFRQGRVGVSMVPGCLLGAGGAGSVTITVTSAAGSPGATGPGAHSPSAGKSPEGRTAPAAGDQPPAGTGPDGAAPDPAAPVPALDGSAPTSDAGAVTSSGSVPMTDTVAAVGAAVPGPPARQGPAGILVFVAAICVAGVSVAAGRAIIAQRAIRVVAA